MRRRLSESQERELVHLLTRTTESNQLGMKHFLKMANDGNIDRAIRNLMQFHALGTNDESKELSHRVVQIAPKVDEAQDYPEEDEIVEDAGLFDHEYVMGAGRGGEEVTTR